MFLNAKSNELAPIVFKKETGASGPKAYEKLALILCEAGRPAEALEALKPFAQSEDPDTQNAIGIALADLGRTPEALRVFEAVAQKYPTNAIAFQNMGIALLKSRNAAGALEKLDRALAINEKLPRALNARRSPPGDQPRSARKLSIACGRNLS